MPSVRRSHLSESTSEVLSKCFIFSSKYSLIDSFLWSLLSLAEMIDETCGVPKRLVMSDLTSAQMIVEILGAILCAKKANASSLR